MARSKQTPRGLPGGKSPRKVLATKAAVKGKRKFLLTTKKSKKAAPGIKKARKFRPGTVALRDIKRYQKVADLLLRRAPFQRLVRETAGAWKAPSRFAASALLALQEAPESYIVKLWDHCGQLAVHAKRVTVLKRDVALVLKIFRPDLALHCAPPGSDALE